MSQCCLTLSFRRGSLWLLCHNARNEILQLVSALGHVTQHEAVVRSLAPRGGPPAADGNATAGVGAGAEGGVHAWPAYQMMTKVPGRNILLYA